MPANHVCAHRTMKIMRTSNSWVPALDTDVCTMYVWVLYVLYIPYSYRRTSRLGLGK